MPGRSNQPTNKLLGVKRVAELLEPMAGSGAVWFMTAECPIPRGTAAPPHVLVAWEEGRELGRWPLHAMAYGSLVSKLVTQPGGPFVIPHADSFAYDEYGEVSNRLAQARSALAELIPPFNALLYRMACLERQAGLSADEVRDWLSRAEGILNVSKGRKLWQLIREVGPPRFATHSAYLVELLPAVQQGTELLKNFLVTTLPPVRLARQREAATTGSRESKWDWVELKPDKGWSLGQLSWSDLVDKQFEYLPEVERNIAPRDFSHSEVGFPASPTPEQLPAETPVRAQLLEIRRQIDTLLAGLD